MVEITKEQLEILKSNMDPAVLSRVLAKVGPDASPNQIWKTYCEIASPAAAAAVLVVSGLRDSLGFRA
jgi:hypothetical protein